MGKCPGKARKNYLEVSIFQYPTPFSFAECATSPSQLPRPYTLRDGQNGENRSVRGVGLQEMHPPPADFSLNTRSFAFGLARAGKDHRRRTQRNDMFCGDSTSEAALKFTEDNNTLTDFWKKKLKHWDKILKAINDETACKWS
jgi:hypothetical protein